jgi:hypothetical protein
MAEFRVLEMKEKMVLEREKIVSNEKIALAQISGQKEIAAENSQKGDGDGDD